jgi:hypothetical protein
MIPSIYRYFHILRIGGFVLTAAFFASGKDLDSLDAPLLSPNGILEVYRVPEGVDKDANGKEESYGTKLFIRKSGSKRSGILLRENARWMAAQWAPHSNLLGIEDHRDGHVSEVYIYEVNLESNSQLPECTLVFHAPNNGYDVQWFIEGWDTVRHIVHLRREEIRHLKSASGEEDFSSNQGRVLSHHSYVINIK